MTNSITISEDTTLGAEHSGMRIIVDTPATITLPHEDTYKNIAGDESEIISCVAGNVNIVGEAGVTVTPISSVLMTKKGASVKVQYQGDNTYFMWGSLAIVLIVAAIGLLAYNYSADIAEAGVMLINIIE